jgi:hypothetical protein
MVGRRQVVLGVLLAGLLLTGSANATWSGRLRLAPVSTDPYFDSRSDVEVDPDGNAVFTWNRVDGMGSAGSYRVEARVRDTSGSLSAVQKLSPLEVSAYSPQVVVDADGGAVFVWTSFDGTNYRIQTRARSASGSLSAVRTLSAAGHDALQPDLGIDADGDAVFTWQLRIGDNYRVQTRAQSETGALSPVQTLSGPNQYPFLLNPHVAVDADGDAIFTWERFGSEGLYGVVQTRARSAGGTLTEVQDVSTRQYSFESQVAVGATGRAVYVWVCGTCQNHRIQARTRSPAGTLSPVQSLSLRGQEVHGPQVAIDASGGAVFAWERFYSEDPDPSPDYPCCYRIDARARSAGGALSPIQNISPGGSEAVSPEVAVDADGNSAIIWNRGMAEVRTRFAAGALGPVRTLSPAGRTVQFPQVAMNAGGEAAATWAAFDGIRENILIQGAVGP